MVVVGVVALYNPSGMVLATVIRLAVYVSKEWYGFVYHHHLPPFVSNTLKHLKRETALGLVCSGYMCIVHRV